MGIIRNGVVLHPLVVFIGRDFSFLPSHGCYEDHGFSFKPLMGSIRTMVFLFFMKIHKLIAQFRSMSGII